MIKNSPAFSSFSVKDLTEAKKFYEKTLGLKTKELKEMGILELHIKGSSPVMVYPKDNHKPATYTVLNFPVKNIEKEVDALSKKGVKFEIYNKGFLKTDKKGISVGDQGPKMAWFKDPAGNFLSLINL